MLQALISLRQFAIRLAPFLIAAVVAADLPITKVIDKASPLMH